MCAGNYVPALISNYKNIDKSNYFLAKNYALNILNQVEPNSIILTSDDTTAFALFYFVSAEKIKPDIRIVYSSTLNSIWYQKELKSFWPDLYQTGSYYQYDIIRSIIETNQNKRPVYFVLLGDPYVFGFDGNPNYLSPRGLVLKADLSTTAESIKDMGFINYWKNYNLSDLEKTYQDPFAQIVKNIYPFRHKVNSKVFLTANCLACAQEELSQALNLFPDNEDLNQVQQELVLPVPDPTEKIAPDYLQSAKKSIESTIYPSDVNYHRAVWDLKQANKLDPSNEEIHGLLGDLYDYLGAYKQAIEEYQKAAGLNPEGKWDYKAEEIRNSVPEELIE